MRLKTKDAINDFLKNHSLSDEECINLLCVSPSTYNKLKSGGQVTYLDRARLFYLGYTIEQCLDGLLDNKTDLYSLIQLAIGYRLTNTTLMTLLEANKTNLSKMLTNKVAIPENGINNLLNCVASLPDCLVPTLCLRINPEYWITLQSEGRLLDVDISSIHELELIRLKEILKSKELELDTTRQKLADTEDKLKTMYQEIDKCRYEPKPEKTIGLPLLVYGNEPDMYNSEIRSILLDSLYSYAESNYTRTRRVTVINDVLEANGYNRNDILARNKDVINDAKKVLNKNVPNMFGPCKISHTRGESGHHKISLNGDSRFSVSTSSTSSDVKAADNFAKLVVNKFF